MRAIELLDQHVHAIGGQPREGQRSLATEITVAIAENRPLVAQAPTGSGKSLAALIPAIESGHSTVVVTATKALQDQLLNKDLPGLRDGLFPGLTFQAMKGRSNYLCLQRWDELTNGVQLALDNSGSATRLPAADESIIARWVDETHSGDRADLADPIQPGTWAQLSVGPDDCNGSDCPFYEACFAEKAKTQAASADVVVANMHLLMADLATHGSVLPEHDVLIVDEVHELPGIAAEMLGRSVSVERIRNLAAQAKAYASDEGIAAADEVIQGVPLLTQILSDAGDRRIPGGASGNPDLANLIPQITGRMATINSAIKAPDGDADLRSKIDRVKTAISNLLTDLSLLFEESPNYVTFVEQVGKRHVLRQCTIDVAPALRDGLWPRATPILMSATVPSNMITLVGLEDGTRNIHVPSPFDFENQAVLYVSAHPKIDPRDDGREWVTAQEAGQLIEAAGGRAIWLFSSFRALDDARRLLPKFTDAEILCQGDAPKNVLVDQLKHADKAVLLGNMSFWTGVDIPGPALQLVMIDKIPFPVPTNPLIEARNELAENDFREVSLPDAATRLTQGVGRLIRSTDDRGVVAVFDPRLAEAGYKNKLRAGFPDFRRSRNLDSVCEYLRYLDQTARAATETQPDLEPEPEPEPPAVEFTPIDAPPAPPFRPTHMLLERSKGLAIAACGYEYEVHAGGLPSDFTGWDSKVSCIDCRTESRVRTQRARAQGATP